MAPIVRPAREADVAALLRLEALCWRPHLRCDEREVRRRLALFSSGQFVLQGEDGSVLGVLYTQRIENAGLLLEGSYAGQFSLHTASGPALQLLAINVDPAAEGAGLADVLRRHALDVAERDPAILEVVAMTRCSQFAAVSAEASTSTSPSQLLQTRPHAETAEPRSALELRMMSAQ